jgi:3',5'-cyclic AMP phosphodiesterase CpdA
MRIIHLSDLHVSSDWFVPQWYEAVAALVNDARPDVTVVTGDLTMEGRRDEYERAHRCLAQLRTRSLLVVPGNHDARNEGYVRFEEMFGTRYPTYANDAVVICGIDSSQPDIDEGRVGRSSLRQIADTLAVEGKVRILAMHHHLMPVPGAGRESCIPPDAGEVLQLCTDTEVDLVLTGHGHLPHFCSRGRTHFITAGSATLWRPSGRSFPSFNVMNIERGSIFMQLVDVSGGWGTQTIATTKVRPGIAVGTTWPRVTPPLPFEVEEFHTQIPEENWRYRPGVPQTLDFPSTRD